MALILGLTLIALNNKQNIVYLNLTSNNNVDA